jgi:hypothetical protein
MTQDVSKPMQAARKRAHNPVSQSLRQSASQGDDRFRQQDQGSGDRHQEKVLHHVKGEPCMVESRERGPDRNPQRQSSADERDQFQRQ